MEPYSLYGIRRRSPEDLHAELAAFVLFNTALACTLTGKRAKVADLIHMCLDHSEASLQRSMAERSRRRIVQAEIDGSIGMDRLQTD